MSEIAARKAQARHEALALRADLLARPEGQAAARQAVAALGRVLGDLPPGRLAGYMALPDELDPLAAMQSWQGSLCLPVVTAKAQPLQFRPWSPGAPLIEGRFRVREPLEAPPVTPDVLIVPLLAWDRAGRRLGYGGGFYDRTLQALRALRPETLAFGLALDAQARLDLPHEAVDQPLDGVVTESGLQRPG